MHSGLLHHKTSREVVNHSVDANPIKKLKLLQKLDAKCLFPIISIQGRILASKMLISARYLDKRNKTSSVYFQYFGIYANSPRIRKDCPQMASFEIMRLPRVINSSWLLAVSCKWDWRHSVLGDEQEVLVGWDVHSSSADETTNFSKTGEKWLKMGLSTRNNNPSLTLSSFKDKIAKQLW